MTGILISAACTCLQNPVLTGVTSDGSTGSDISGGLATSPVGGLSGYSPFMGMPWGNNMNSYLSEGPAGPHIEIPESPMSPGEQGEEQQKQCHGTFTDPGALCI